MVAKQADSRTCYNCGKIIHLAKNCRLPKKGAQQKPSETQQNGQNGRKNRSDPKTEHAFLAHETKGGANLMHEQETDSGRTDSSKWYLDSAASHHYCNDKAIMYDIQSTD
ncbi:hypothetical protein LIPSTDRAFT_74959, partial [Lipomyces starkeyi NRRL Y-11557]